MSYYVVPLKSYSKEHCGFKKMKKRHQHSPFTKALISASVAIIPAFNVTRAAGSSPARRSGSPMTPASAMAG